jgi:putative effector of murein hydrolase LrgA (UPF0299 family)
MGVIFHAICVGVVEIPLLYHSQGAEVVKIVKVCIINEVVRKTLTGWENMVLIRFSTEESNTSHDSWDRQRFGKGRIFDLLYFGEI